MLKRMLLFALILLPTGACAQSPRQMQQQAAPMGQAMSPAESREVREGYARVRAATDRFHSLDSAVAAGYARDVPRCFADEHHGAMGFHHLNRAYLDTVLDVERPEILLYERHPDGRYVLNGVEFIVPYRLWSRDSAAPRIMGLPLERADDLNLWYMHMWAWKPNPAGLFAPYNPTVRCPEM